MTTTETATIHFTHDDGETITSVQVEVSFYEYYDGERMRNVREYKAEFLEPFDKDSHGMWESELSDQVKQLFQ